MFPKFIKIVLAVLSLGYAVYQFTEEFIGNGIALIFLSGMFVFLYYKNEILLLAFLRMRKQDFCFLGVSGMAEATELVFSVFSCSFGPRFAPQ